MIRLPNSTTLVVQRFFDVVLSLIGLLLLLPLFIVALTITFIDTGSPLFFQRRLGIHKREFYLVKFRTMAKNTPNIASHLVDPRYITRIGAMLRRLKIDELPQLWNVLLGDMSLVGPRPNLPEQLELTHEREMRDVYEVRPGITGLAQVNNIDMSEPEELAILDKKMIETFNLFDYFKYIFMTVAGRGIGDAARQAE